MPDASDAATHTHQYQPDPLPWPPMRQEAPYPAELDDLVRALTYRPGWKAELKHLDRGQGSAGLTLIITTLGYDTYHADAGPHMRVHHYMPVPPAAYNRRSWQRWLFAQYLAVEQHEAQEWFQIAGHRPYAPLHGPGNDPYLIAELATDEERRTNFRGDLEEGSP